MTRPTPRTTACIGRGQRNFSRLTEIPAQCLTPERVSKNCPSRCLSFPPKWRHAGFMCVFAKQDLLHRAHAKTSCVSCRRIPLASGPHQNTMCVLPRPRARGPHQRTMCVVSETQLRPADTNAPECRLWPLASGLQKQQIPKRWWCCFLCSLHWATSCISDQHIVTKYMCKRCAPWRCCRNVLQ